MLNNHLFTSLLTIYLVLTSIVNANIVSKNLNLPETNQLSQSLGFDPNFLRIKTRKLSSRHDLSYSFYTGPFCEPETIERSYENFGDFLFGDRIENSVYNLEYKQDIKCKRLRNGEAVRNGRNKNEIIKCPTFTSDIIDSLKTKIQKKYNVELLADGLPIANRQHSAFCGELPDDRTVDSLYTSAEGFSLGCENSMIFLNNHWSFKFDYYEDSYGNKRVVGADVIPSSIDWNDDLECKDDNMPSKVEKLYLSNDLVGKPIPWSYSVKWERSTVRYASRWDAYLAMSTSDIGIQWFSIINSIGIVIALSGLIAAIMVRVLKRDISMYVDDREESGWHFLHADIFRTPTAPGLLSIIVGTGVQIILMVFVSLALTFIGFVSIAHRGSIIQVMIVLFVLLGAPAGYISIRFYKLMGGERWKGIAFLTAILFPGIIFTIFSIINLLLMIGSHSSNAIPVTQILLVMVLWFFVTVPLVFVGAIIGWRQKPLEHPVSVARLPRLIPPGNFWTSKLVIPLGGVLPFCTVLIQLYFIMSSVWLHRYYFLFGLTFIVFLIFLLICAEITIVLIFFQMCGENYHWWWRSIFIPGSTAIYLFIFSMVYFYWLHIDSFLLAIVYFEYMGMISFACFLLTGATGFIASLWFLRVLFRSIKVA